MSFWDIYDLCIRDDHSSNLITTGLAICERSFESAYSTIESQVSTLVVTAPTLSAFSAKAVRVATLAHILFTTDLWV
ncbi:hypothetical protein K7432_010580 [Basidiobolus ranarum]|uniref:Uncharacterized protein n=1 Tax=Basidiobolus ranarum TaxID=34480 RepID=A0ABR2VVD1_9FUNG